MLLQEVYTAIDAISDLVICAYLDGYIVPVVTTSVIPTKARQ